MKFNNILFEKDQIPNVISIMNGGLIVLCKKSKSAYSEDDIIFLLSSSNAGMTDITSVKRNPSNFLLSEKGKELLTKYGKNKIVDTDVIVKVEDIPIKTGESAKYKLKRFFQEMYDKGLFSLWDVEHGPLKYFSRSKEGFLRFYRSYKIPVKITYNQYKLVKPYAPPIIKDDYINNTLLNKLNSIDLFANPILSNSEYNLIKGKIMELAANSDILINKEKKLESKDEEIIETLDIESLVNQKKQIILYGPPGTGKTYNTKMITINVIGGIQNEYYTISIKN